MSRLTMWNRQGQAVFDLDSYVIGVNPIEAMLEKLAHYEDLEEQGRLKVQVHGQWEIFTDEYDCEYMLCTACGGEFYPVDEDTVDMTYNYCPNCGAKMR